MTVWKPWKTLAVLQAACKERNLDTSYCTIKREYCQVLNDYEARQAAAESVTPPPVPSDTAPQASPKNHKRHDSKDLATTPTKLHTPATRQDLRTARADLERIHQKVPLVLEQAKEVQISFLKVASDGKVVSRISKLRSGILAFNVEGVKEADISHYVKETKDQTEWLEFELQQLVDAIVARQKRRALDYELVKQDSGRMMAAMLDSVHELVLVRDAVMQKVHSLQYVEVEDSTDWPLAVDVGSEHDSSGSYEQRLGELEREMSWLEQDIAKWEGAIADWEELMG